jgi:hypothetical protein
MVYRDIDPNGKAITICSIDPNDPNIIAATIIDCNGAWLDGVVYKNSSECNFLKKLAL